MDLVGATRKLLFSESLFSVMRGRSI